MQERLQKVIAAATTYSRRKAEDLIVLGKVTVNGKTVKELGTKVDTALDVVAVEGRRLRTVVPLRYIILNKPLGYICTRAQHKNEQTVYDLVPESRDLVIAGRLDRDSEGLVLLTNDGELVNTLTHPRYEHSKEYVVTVDVAVKDADIVALTKGIRLEEGIAKADDVTRIDSHTIRMTVHQGWNRQIRRMMNALGYTVDRLVRVRLGALSLEGIPSGQFRVVDKEDITG